MPPHGSAGLRLGAAGPAGTITYKDKSDRRLDFDKLGWKNFLEGNNLQSGQPVLIILRKTSNPSLEVMIEMRPF